MTSHSATIASFNYTPFDVRIAVGDSVVWRNADPTVHTVTASRGEFSSGSMRQGQAFRATFTVPGVYPYFCEPHEQMRGTVSVTGPAPTTTTTAGPATTTTMLSFAPSATTATTFVATQPLPAREDAPNHTGSVAATPRVVVASQVTGTPDLASPVAPIGALLLLVAASMAALVRVGVTRANACRYLAAGATAATGLVHLQLRIELAYPEPIGTLLVIEAAGAAVLTVWLLARPWNRVMQLSAIGAHLAALGALAITRTSVGLFGFREIGWDPSPQLPLAVIIGATAIALLGAAGSNR